MASWRKPSNLSAREEAWWEDGLRPHWHYDGVSNAKVWSGPDLPAPSRNEPDVWSGALVVGIHAEAARQYTEGCRLDAVDDVKGAYTCFHAAALAGYLPAVNRVGVAHQLGRGVAVDLKEAVAWYRLASSRGHAKSRFNLANVYQQQGELGVAAALYQSAADQGHAKATARLALSCYRGGVGVERDHERAHRLLIKARDLGCSTAATALDTLHFDAVQPPPPTDALVGAGPSRPPFTPYTTKSWTGAGVV